MTPTLRAALWMAGAIAAFISMAIAGREVSTVHDTFEIMFYRSVIGLVLVIGYASALRRLHDIRQNRMGLHLMRNIAHFTGQNLWFYALTAIPLAQVFALEFTSPVWVILLSPLMLGERLTRTGLLAAALGFAGILIVARPDMGHLSPGVIAAALCAVGFALSAILTKQLTRTETVIGILFWLCLMQMAFGLIMAGYDGDLALPTADSLPWLGLIGLAGLMAHLCLTTALSIAPASAVMPMDFLRLPVIVAVGAWLYAEPVDPWVLAGAALILSGNYLNLRTRTRA